MKLTKKILAEIGIYNPHNYANGNLYIEYIGGDNGRLTAHYPYWRAWQEGKKFSEHWADYGAYKLSVVSRYHKESVLEEIMEWAEQTCGIKEWEKTPFGTYMEKSFVEKRNKEILDIIETKKLYIE